jgi:hypothetical protein
MGEKYGESLNKLRKMTALWIYDKLGKSSNKYGWTKISGCVKVIVCSLAAKLLS